MPDTPSSDNGTKLIPPNANFAGKAHCPSLAKYEEMYQRSIEDPEGFWAEIADDFVWQKKWDKVRDYSFEGNVHIKWFIDGKTNISVNAWTGTWRQRGDQVALIWEGNAPDEQKQADLQAAAHGGLQVRQRAEVAGRQEGRPRLHVHADDPGAADRDAGLRPDRRDPLGRVRRVQRGFAARPHPGLRVQDC